VTVRRNDGRALPQFDRDPANISGCLTLSPTIPEDMTTSDQCGLSCGQPALVRVIDGQTRLNEISLAGCDLINGLP
jgi:hypothetical protein